MRSLRGILVHSPAELFDALDRDSSGAEPFRRTSASRCAPEHLFLLLSFVLPARQPPELLHLVQLPQHQLPQLLQQSAALDFIVVREILLRLRLVIRGRVAPGGVRVRGERLL